MLTTRLLVISSTPSTIENGKTVLNTKFVAGMEKFSAGWNGPVTCLLPLHQTIQPFSDTYDTEALPFAVKHRVPGRPIEESELAGVDIVLASGDNSDCLGLVPLVHAAGGKIVYIIENIPKTRRRIVLLERSKSRLEKWKSLLWMEKTELMRRRAFAKADGLQANGYPAWDLYAAQNRDPILFLDNRISRDLLATREEIEARHQRLMTGAPLQIIHSGRLEPLKGSHELLPVAVALRARNIAFDMHIFGTGSLEDELRSGIKTADLGQQVHLHGSVDFTKVLVPFCREKGDLFLSCHLQSDPSCTYLESFGAGMPIVGYENQMWLRLQEQSQAGWTSPTGDVGALVDCIAGLDQNRQGISDAGARAHAFAADHLFGAEFDLRLEHLKRVSQTAVRSAETRVQQC